MARQIVAANWKMHGNKTTITGLLQHLQQLLVSANSLTEVIVFPSFVYLPLAEKLLRGSMIHYGAQLLNQNQAGAYTGEIAGSMLSDFACQYVLVGHSERRLQFAESDTVVAEKFAAAQQNGLIPLLCIGETLQQHEAGQTLMIIEQQLQSVLTMVGIEAFKQAVIAYEPVWAIGTGKTATPEQAQAVHAHIRGFLGKQNQQLAMQLPLLYGGSVKASNAAALAEMSDIDGVLVGGASLDAHEFIKIIEAF